MRKQRGQECNISSPGASFWMIQSVPTRTRFLPGQNLFPSAYVRAVPPILQLFAVTKSGDPGDFTVFSTTNLRWLCKSPSAYDTESEVRGGFGTARPTFKHMKRKQKRVFARYSAFIPILLKTELQSTLDYAFVYHNHSTRNKKHTTTLVSTEPLQTPCTLFIPVLLPSFVCSLFRSSSAPPLTYPPQRS